MCHVFLERTCILHVGLLLIVLFRSVSLLIFGHLKVLITERDVFKSPFDYAIVYLWNFINSLSHITWCCVLDAFIIISSQSVNFSFLSLFIDCFFPNIPFFLPSKTNLSTLIITMTLYLCPVPSFHLFSYSPISLFYILNTCSTLSNIIYLTASF